MEIHALQKVELGRSRCLQEAQKNYDVEAHIPREADYCTVEGKAQPGTMGEDAVDNWSNAATVDTASVGSFDPPIDEDISLGDALFNRASKTTPATWEDDEFLTKIKAGYAMDKLVTLILEKPTDYRGFKVDNHLMWHTNPKGDKVVCIPHNCELILWILDQAHATLGHFRDQHTTEYV